VQQRQVSRELRLVPLPCGMAAPVPDTAGAGATPAPPLRCRSADGKLSKALARVMHCAQREGVHMRDWITALTLLTMGSVPGAAMAQERPWEWGMHPGPWMWGAGGLLMMLMMLVFWGVVIAAIVIGLRWLVSQGRQQQPDRALDILRERYARGELSKEEFEARRQDLRDRAA
jgi:putative membrane protein